MNQSDEETKWRSLLDIEFDTPMRVHTWLASQQDFDDILLYKENLRRKATIKPVALSSPTPTDFSTNRAMRRAAKKTGRKGK